MQLLEPIKLSSPITCPRRVSVVVPTYREAASIPDLVARLDEVRQQAGLEMELLLMDDDSRDGTDSVVGSLGKDWVKLVVRTTDRGLSQAVLDGLGRASGEYLVVMDADLSHPPQAIVAMLDALDAGADMAIGSRFVEGASTAESWGAFRQLNSKVATLLALPLTRLSDPMSGFFAMRRSTFAAGREFNPLGYKIGLELMLKCPVQRVAEVPIHFANRVHGESKLSLREQVKYLRHLGRLYWYTASHRDRHRPVSLRLPAAEPWGSLSAEQTTIAA